MLVVLNLCMVWGLEGDNCKKESAEKCEAEAGGQHDVARRKGGFEFGFGFVGHGFGFSVRQSYNASTLLRPLLSFFFWGIYTRCGISFSKLSAFAIFLRYRV